MIYKIIRLSFLSLVLFVASCIGLNTDITNNKANPFAYNASLVNKKSTASIVLATWNIGHFSNGSKAETQIKENQYASKLSDYIKIIYDDLNSEILCLNEYSTVFCRTSSKDYLTSSTILDRYKYHFVGEQLGYNCNAIFSNKKIKQVEKKDFECSIPYLGKNPKAAQHYYLECELSLGKTKAKLVCVHLISREPELCYAQMLELIEKYKDYEKVIMCGDWNALDFSIFRRSGYVMANDGSLKTYPLKSYPLDNIIVKGLKIDDVKMVKTDLSDHNPLVCRLSLL